MNKLQIERKKRLSQSLLWYLQRQYFDEQGVDAWTGAVPYFVTSNCYAAECYASVVMNFISDWLSQHKESKKEPFYLLELGTGPGQFSFYMLKKINELKNLRVQLFDCGLQILDFGFYKIETKKKKINYMYLF